MRTTRLLENRSDRIIAAAVVALVGVTVLGVAVWGGPGSTEADPNVAAGVDVQPSGSVAATAGGPSPSGVKPRPSTSATATPTKRPPSASPKTSRPRTPAGAKPDATNTGVRPGVQLAVVNGNVTFSTSGAVVEGKEFRGFVHVTGRNITFRNCLFRGGVATNNEFLLTTVRGTNTVVEDSEFAPAHPSARIDGIWAQNVSIYRANIHGSVDGVKTGSNVLIQDSFIHDLTWFASDPNQGGGETHNDGVQSLPGDTKLTLRHNTIDVSSLPAANAALQNAATEVRIENNWLDGGQCTLNFHPGNSSRLTSLYVVGNRFGRHSYYRCPILLSTQSSLAENSGNVWVDTNQPIPAPQQHN
ncbi:hypothetical protein [Catellatospora citrea]|uniref:Parallel beta helix pectate lyase-like protein n=1 Tax=Catellatospora citrea TaxID=53366 RepID=A0A8J3P3V3_9ACTN|nr:hypothetical protein [Catellatospora citrea]RKE09663.1 hypothetical protein C8E86_4553 [Catellatospora citrea]GIG02704.1 hypothetical protein Cci01nite_77970 [Catellatospora citrea]